MKQFILKSWILVVFGIVGTALSAQTPVTFDPMKDATDVVVDKVLTIAFDQVITKGAGGIVNIVRSSDNDVLGSYFIRTDFTSGEITVVGNQLIINPIPDFVNGEQYYVTIAEGAIAGFTGIDNSESNNWRFTIVPLPVVISSSDPLQDETNVVIDKTLTLTFNQNISKGTGGTLQIIKSSGLALVGDYFISTGFTSSEITVVGNQVIINPQFSFEEGELYYVTIANTAIADFEGIDNSSLNNWRFTTINPTPTIITYDPIQGATGVAIDKSLTLTFDQTISKGSGGVVEVIRSSDLAVLGHYLISTGYTSTEITVSGSQLIINPIPDFVNGEQYNVTIAEGAITGFTGIDNSESNNWRFTAVIPGPEITVLNPYNESLGVGLDDILTVTFDQDIQFGDGPSTIFIKKYVDDTNFQSFVVWESMGSTDAGLSITNNQLSITHNTFEEGTEYYVVIESGAIESTAGVVFEGLLSKDLWHFTSFIPVPEVTGLNPLDGATDVWLDNVLTVTFNQNIFFQADENNPKSIRIRRYDDLTVFQSFEVAGGITSSFLSITDNVLTITHESFEGDTHYYVTIGDGALLNQTGQVFAGFTDKDSWDFVTIIEADPPSIIEGGLTPISGTIEVSRNPVLSVAFNENIVVGTEGYFKIFDLLNNEIATVSRTSSQVSIVDNELTVSLTSTTLPYGTECYVLIDPGFVRSATTGVNFPGISDPAYWYFTIETAPPFWATGYPSITLQDADVFTFNGQTDQNGDMYFVVTGTGTPAPDAEQISNGLNGSGTSAKIAFNSVMTANTLLSDLNAFNESTPQGTSYYLYAVALSGEKASEIIRIDIDRNAPIIEPGLSNPANGDMIVPVDAEISIVFSEMIYGYVGPGVEAIDATYFSLKDGEVDVPFTFSVNATGETVTLTPMSPLAGNTEYTVTIQSIADAYGNSTTVITRNFETDKLNQWTGGGDYSDWSLSDNWLDGSFVSGKSVIIPATATAFPVIDDESVDVNNLIVEAGAVVTLTGSGILNINGIFNLQSSPDINASLVKTGGTLNVAPANVHIDQVVSVSNETYIISSPVAGVTKASLGATDRMFWYDNTSDSFVEFAIGTMDIGRGYLARSTQDLVFSGAINDGEVVANATFTDGEGYGWNMVGNPYPSAVNWETITKSPEIENAVWIWKHFEGVYGTYSSESGVSINITDPWIPSNHGFLIKVKAEYTSGSITFKPSDMGSNTTSYLKSGSTGNVMPHFKLAGVYGSHKDETAVILTSEAVSGVDRFDAQKYFSNSSKVLEVYTLAGGMKTAINGIPYTEYMEMALGYSAQNSGTYSFDMVLNSLENVKVLLIDKSCGNVTDMTKGGSYEFDVAVAGKNHSRFVLKFIQEMPSAINEPSIGTLVKVFSKDQKIFVQVPYSENQFEYELSDVSGRRISKGMITNDMINTIPVQSAGTYIVTIKGPVFEEVKNYKVVVY